MNALVLEDAREYVFPVFSVRAQDNGVFLESRTFLGTGFFVTKRGDAITASHVIPTPDELKERSRLIAIVQVDGEAKVCWITRAAKFALFDIALFHVNLPETQYLPVSTEQVAGGADIQVIGIPSHEVWASGKEMRLLKGHVTLSARHLELNFPVPAGMSGAPVFLHTKVIGYVTGTVRSEEIEEANEEIDEVENGREVIRITEIRRIIHYGLAYPFSHMSAVRDPVLEGKTFFEFIATQNDEP
ncbi:MAG: serine protease [Pseudomonadota bacterium]|nr:serine protease [Pseudomonadota bacterium]